MTFMKINVTIGKMMNDRGYKTARIGKSKTTNYIISNKSKIVSHMNNSSNNILL